MRAFSVHADEILHHLPLSTLHAGMSVSAPSSVRPTDAARAAFEATFAAWMTFLLGDMTGLMRLFARRTRVPVQVGAAAVARGAEFRILVAVDGSAHARAALAAVMRGPWPVRARVRAVAARRVRGPHQRLIVLTTLDRRADDAVEQARRTLARRWPDAGAVVVDTTPVNGILAEATRFRADMIGLGWRGDGPVRRLLMGSVSRGVVRGARCAVLVARRAPAHIQNIVLAIDGSSNARRAVSLVAKFAPARDGHVTLVHAVELLVPTSRGPAVRGIRASIARGLKRINAQRSEAARRELNRAAGQLERAGWRTRTEMRNGEPLREVMDAVSAAKAQLVVVGARGTSGVRRLLLGSVADGVLNRSPVPVLLVR